jgi:hypothetical protein
MGEAARECHHVKARLSSGRCILNDSELCVLVIYDRFVTLLQNARAVSLPKEICPQKVAVLAQFVAPLRSMSGYADGSTY